MDDRDPTALLVAAAAARDEYVWHAIVDRYAAAPARHRELLRLLMADPPLCYAQISRRQGMPADQARGRWGA